MNEYDYDPNPVLLNVTNYTYDTNGNLVTTTDTDNEVDSYEYYSDLVNIMPVIIPGQGTPQKSSNRISTIVQTADDGTLVTQTFTYF